jgi:hypothetical protein
MSFAIFRKYEKPIMWATVIFSVLIFATFSGFGSLKNLLSQHATVEVYGEFDVKSTGERHVVTTADFMGVRQAMSRFAYVQSGSHDVKDPEVWAHLIALEEARGAGLEASDHDVGDYVQQMFGGQPITREQYTYVWRDRLGFASAHDLERFLHDTILGSRWMQFEAEAAGLVNADDVYLRWRGDNERFDYDAIVIPDLTDEQIPEPSGDELQKFWDDLPEVVRDATYSEPRRLDVAYAWAPLGEGEHAIPAEKVAAQPEPSADDVQQRFEIVGETRWPDVHELSDEMKAALTRELRVMSVAQQAKTAFDAAEDKSVDSFRKLSEAAGLTVADPEGLLGPDELAKLPDIGNERLPNWLSNQPVGSVYVDDSTYAPDQLNVHLVLIQAEQARRPLTFEEAHDKLVKAWRDGQRDKTARDFREALRKAARELPECAAVIQPLLDAAQKRADEAAAALTDATDEARAAARKEVLDASERTEIAARIAEFEHLAWDKVPRPDNARVLSFAGVPKSYSRHPTGDEEPTSVERQLKVASAIFRLGVDAVSEPVRHTQSAQTAIVIVRARSFPEKSEMFADTAGMDTARRILGQQRASETQRSMSPEMLMASRNLKVAEIAKKTPEGEDGIPPDA